MLYEQDMDVSQIVAAFLDDMVKAGKPLSTSTVYCGYVKRVLVQLNELRLTAVAIQVALAAIPLRQRATAIAAWNLFAAWTHAGPPDRVRVFAHTANRRAQTIFGPAAPLGEADAAKIAGADAPANPAGWNILFPGPLTPGDRTTIPLPPLDPAFSDIAFLIGERYTTRPPHVPPGVPCSPTPVLPPLGESWPSPSAWAWYVPSLRHRWTGAISRPLVELGFPTQILPAWVNDNEMYWRAESPHLRQVAVNVLPGQPGSPWPDTYLGRAGADLGLPSKKIERDNGEKLEQVEAPTGLPPVEYGGEITLRAAFWDSPYRARALKEVPSTLVPLGGAPWRPAQWDGRGTPPFPPLVAAAFWKLAETNDLYSLVHGPFPKLLACLRWADIAFRIHTSGYRMVGVRPYPARLDNPAKGWNGRLQGYWGVEQVAPLFLLLGWGAFTRDEVAAGAPCVPDRPRSKKPMSWAQLCSAMEKSGYDLRNPPAISHPGILEFFDMAGQANRRSEPPSTSHA